MHYLIIWRIDNDGMASVWWSEVIPTWVRFMKKMWGKRWSSGCAWSNAFLLLLWLLVNENFSSLCSLLWLFTRFRGFGMFSNLFLGRAITNAKDDIKSWFPPGSVCDIFFLIFRDNLISDFYCPSGDFRVNLISWKGRNGRKSASKLK